MRCKPNQMAWISTSPLGLNLGRVVQCVKVVGTHSEFGPVWRVTSKGKELVTDLGVVCVSCDVPDAWLTPINDDSLNTDDVGTGRRINTPEVA